VLRLSQGQLTALSYCPRRFQHTSLDSLVVPPTPEQLLGQQWGDRFHLLMQQQEMGLVVDPMLAEDQELQTCLQTLHQQAPDLFDTTGEIFRQSEHGRSQVVNGYWFTVVYDLLRQWRDRAEIIDWKTHLTPKPQKVLRDDWQTRLYLYTLVETSAYSPHQVAMTYWFVRAMDEATGALKPRQIQITYSEEQHDRTHQDLLHLTERLTHLLAKAEPLPQIPLGDPKCGRCPFAVRCQRGEAGAEGTLEVPSLDAIEELIV